MAHLRSVLAIFLMLALLVSPTTLVRADDPGTYDASGGNTNDGHPWDDEIVETDPPGEDPSAPGINAFPGGIPPINPPSMAAGGSGAQFFARVIGSMLESWLWISDLKVTRSKTVKRVR